MSSEDDLINLSMPALHWVLAKRLPHSRSWNNVEVTTTKKVVRIKWFEPKKEDPEGKETFCVHERPLSLRSVDAEIERQMAKYLKEIGSI